MGKICREVQHNLCCQKFKEHWQCIAAGAAACALVAIELVNYGVIR